MNVFSHGPCQHDEDHRDRQAPASLPPGQCQHSLQSYQVKKYIAYCKSIQCSRLLKGAPPGQEAVNHYISELSIEKKNNHKLADKERKHLVMLEVLVRCSFFLLSYSYMKLLITSSLYSTFPIGFIQNKEKSMNVGAHISQAGGRPATSSD